LTVVLLFVAALISAGFVVGDAVTRFHGWFDHRFEWRDAEYRKLTSLQAGFTLAKFRAELGEPLFQRAVSDTVPQPFARKNRSRQGFTESTFRGRDYWVQTISAQGGTVLSYAVTSCDAQFRPTFTGPFHSFSLTLNKSTFDDVVPWKRARGLLSTYFPSGATANSFFYDVMYGGNPLDYKSFAWGLDDACPGWFPYYESLYKRKLIPFGKGWSFHGSTRRGDGQVMRFRQTATINTYAETAPTAWHIDYAHSFFQIGVDRILIRPTTD
jgi:hypothetical protein